MGAPIKGYSPGGTAAQVQAADDALGRTGVPKWLHIGQRGIGCEECDRKMDARNRRRVKRERAQADRDTARNE
jgi:hypothetical protein